MFIGLKPRDERDASVDAGHHPAAAEAGRSAGLTLFLQAAQDLNVGGRTSQDAVSSTRLQDADLDELNDWAPKILDKLQELPMLRDVATDQQNSGTTLTLTIDRDMAARFGIQPQLIDDTLYDAFGQRQVTQYFTQLNTYHVILEVTAGAAGRPGDARQALRQLAGHRRDGAALRLRQMDDRAGQPLSINHQGQFPAVTLRSTCARASRWATATTAIQKAMDELQLPATMTGDLPGHRPGVPGLADDQSAI